jgi:hypothetical protein
MDQELLCLWEQFVFNADLELLHLQALKNDMTELLHHFEMQRTECHMTFTVKDEQPRNPTTHSSFFTSLPTSNPLTLPKWRLSGTTHLTSPAPP